MEEEDIDILKDIVEYATFELSLDGAIEDILREEMPAHFNRQKKLDEVIKIIQKRVYLYLEESR